MIPFTTRDTIPTSHPLISTPHVHPTHKHLAPSQSACPPADPTAESSSCNICLLSRK
ncbi:hypothetical protein M405DRAFT_832189 [Rhizopogon salebrosus TDB-379]|nr:hypothetical protein M405DRAFT_832189 [Rhizopogon salebrosus TDB-379]